MENVLVENKKWRRAEKRQKSQPAGSKHMLLSASALQIPPSDFSGGRPANKECFVYADGFDPDGLESWLSITMLMARTRPAIRRPKMSFDSFPPGKE